MPTEPRSVAGTGCGGMQETGGIGTARSNATENAKLQACCSAENADTFELVDVTTFSKGKRTCVDLKASITCHENAGACYREKSGTPKL